MKVKSTSDIYKEYDKLSCPNKLSIMCSAISFMQQYNGRTKLECIALSLGYTPYEGEWDSKSKTYKNRGWIKESNTK